MGVQLVILSGHNPHKQCGGTGRVQSLRGRNRRLLLITNISKFCDMLKNEHGAILKITFAYHKGFDLIDNYRKWQDVTTSKSVSK